MEYKVGDLVLIASAVNSKKYHSSAALVIAAYQDQPRIFLHNKEANRKWLEDEDVEAGWVYDIIYDGHIEVAVMGEWLVPFKKSSTK